MFPKDMPQAELIEAAKRFDLARRLRVDWAKAFLHLPEKDIIKAAGGPRGIYSDKMPVATGGEMIQRMPGSPAWRKGGLWHRTPCPSTSPASGS